MALRSIDDFLPKAITPERKNKKNIKKTSFVITSSANKKDLEEKKNKLKKKSRSEKKKIGRKDRIRKPKRRQKKRKQFNQTHRKILFKKVVFVLRVCQI